MAESLPWFKFDAAKWITGDITLEDLEAQGVFINICAQYWFKSGNLSLSEIKRRLSAAKPTAFESLIERGIITVIDDAISISFLDEQIQERQAVSAQNSLNGARGGRPKSEKKPTALIPLSETKAKKSREEERRGEQSRVEETRTEEKREDTPTVPFEGDVLNSWNDWVKFRAEIKKKLTPTSIQQQIKFLTKGGRAGPEIIAIISKSIQNGWQGLFELNDNDRKFTKTPEPARAPSYERTGGFGKL